MVFIIKADKFHWAASPNSIWCFWHNRKSIDSLLNEIKNNVAMCIIQLIPMKKKTIYGFCICLWKNQIKNEIKEKRRGGGVPRIGLRSNCLNSWKICKYQLMADWEGYPLHECVFHNDIRRLSQLLRVNDVSLKDMHGIILFLFQLFLFYCQLYSFYAHRCENHNVNITHLFTLYDPNYLYNSFNAGMNSGHFW